SGYSSLVLSPTVVVFAGLDTVSRTPGRQGDQSKSNGRWDLRGCEGGRRVAHRAFPPIGDAELKCSQWRAGFRPPIYALQSEDTMNASNFRWKRGLQCLVLFAAALLAVAQCADARVVAFEVASNTF